MADKTRGVTKKLNKVMGRIQRSTMVKALVGGMMLIMFPVTMVGSISSLLNGIPIGAWTDFLEVTKLSVLFSSIYNITTNFVAIFTTFGIACIAAKNKKEDGAVVGIISVVSFLIMTPLTETIANGRVSYSLGFTWLGSAGMFSAIIVAFLSSFVYCKLKKKAWTIKLPESVPTIISDGFSAIIPGAITLGLFALINVVFTLTPFGCFHACVYAILQIPLKALGNNLFACLIVCFLVQLMWMFGVHGGMTIIPLVAVIWSIADNQNLIAYNSGQEMTNVVGTQFFNFAYFAGTGLGLAICMILFAKSKKYKELGKLGIVPAAFGITEPLLYGTPIVMNFKMAIPFFLSPMISMIITYLAIVLGIVPKMAGITTPSGTPIIIRGLLQGSWKFGVLQAVLVIVWVLIWFPFFKRIDKDACVEEQQLIEASKG